MRAQPTRILGRYPGRIPSYPAIWPKEIHHDDDCEPPVGNGGRCPQPAEAGSRGGRQAVQAVPKARRGDRRAEGGVAEGSLRQASASVTNEPRAATRAAVRTNRSYRHRYAESLLVGGAVARAVDGARPARGGGDRRTTRSPYDLHPVH